MHWVIKYEHLYNMDSYGNILFVWDLNKLDWFKKKKTVYCVFKTHVWMRNMCHIKGIVCLKKVFKCPTR